MLLLMSSMFSDHIRRLTARLQIEQIVNAGPSAESSYVVNEDMNLQNFQIVYIRLTQYSAWNTHLEKQF